MLLIASAIGAPIMSSNCSALKYVSDSKEHSVSDSPDVYQILTGAIRNFFRANETKNLISIDQLDAYYETLINIEDDKFNEHVFDKRFKELKEIFKKAGFVFENEKELTQFRYIFLDEYEKNFCNDENDCETKEYLQDTLTSERRHRMRRIRNRAARIKSHNKTSQTNPQMKSKDEEKKPKKEQPDKEIDLIRRQTKAKLDLKSTRKKRVPMYKIKIGKHPFTTVEKSLLNTTMDYIKDDENADKMVIWFKFKQGSI